LDILEILQRLLIRRNNKSAREDGFTAVPNAIVLTFSFVHVYADEARRPCNMSALPIGYMLVRLGIDVPFSQAEVNDMDYMTFFRLPSDHEVFWFDIAENEALRMNVLHSANLKCNQYHKYM
jgi:hypothetical protein